MDAGKLFERFLPFERTFSSFWAVNTALLYFTRYAHRDFDELRPNFRELEGYFLLRWTLK